MSDEQKVATAGEHCTHLLEAIREWSSVSAVIDPETVNKVRLAVMKSCLLDRIVWCGEHPSQTPCPVHKGVWSGRYYAWPGKVWAYMDGSTKPVEVQPLMQEWYDAGCRCFQHRCGCSTGWQPDEACGCVKPEEEQG